MWRKASDKTLSAADEDQLFAHREAIGTGEEHCHDDGDFYDEGHWQHVLHDDDDDLHVYDDIYDGGQVCGGGIDNIDHHPQRQRRHRLNIHGFDDDCENFDDFVDE